jgi:hypothetical protein
MSLFRDWLDPILKDRDIKVAEFCRGVSISREAFYRYYNNKMKPSARTWINIKDYLQLEWGEIPNDVKGFKNNKGRPRYKHEIRKRYKPRKAATEL